MVAKDQQIDKTLKTFGLALTIPSVLVCGPLLGYGAAGALIKKGASPSILPLLVGVGSILALVQIFVTVKLILAMSDEPGQSKKQSKKS